ncbi:ubiquitin-specific protease doa4 [Sporothrix eucalyptigena]|uniref:Ubiquitin-specific protease doa4 n=1 Tax=Sporothrix eucalyptigena TaxID=1812306 RepID=A0ABP0C700_9PEZI
MANGYNPGAAGANGANGAGGANGNGAAPPPASGKIHNYMHFDDIKNAKLGVDSVTPVETVLGYAESCIKQADFMKDYGRLDMALKEYILASIALLEVLPSNSAWMSVMTDQKGARTRYNALMARISASSAAYEAIKAQVKEDNARSGVQPKIMAPPAQQQTKQNGTTLHRSNGINGHRATGSIGLLNGDNVPPPRPTPQAPPPPTTKAKPVIHPKPQALHGNAIKPGGSKTAQELAERFANLRTASSPPTKEPVQDPRIRTQPINHPSFQQLQKLQTQQPPAQPPSQNQNQPLPQSSSLGQLQNQSQQNIYSQFQNFQMPMKGFESLPRPTNPTIMHGHALPDLPKLPDAIYSPARGSVSSQATQMSVTTPRGTATPRGGMYSRTNSLSSFSGLGTSKATSSSQTEDYFSSPYTHSRQSSRPSQDSTRPKKSRVSIPDGETISAQELLKLMQAGSKDVQLLLVDIRSREEFDEGHIMSQSTICVEADVLQREDISASQIADSMVLAPAAEKRLFDRRGDADLVVFYDDDSETIKHNGKASSEAERAVAGFYDALAYYDYQSDSSDSSRPKLLKGGIEAWISMMGSNSLQTSSTSSETTDNSGRAAAIRAARAAQRSRQNTFTRRQSKYMAKPIQDADEAKRWEESLMNMDKSAGFVRTTDDFLRRFPPVSEIKESMTTTPTATQDDSEIGFHSPTAADGSFTITPLHDRPSSQAAFRSGSAAGLDRRGQAQLSSPAKAAAAAAATAASLYSTLPAPPTRPPPTVPRQTHNDVAETEDEEHYMRTKMAKAGVTGGGRMRRQKVGLYNPDNWCYGNSSFQSMFASGSFADELTTGEWLSNWKVPMKTDEKISHPQLLAKILANSFHWMQFGKFEAMKAKTLMDYCYHIHSRDFDGSIKTDRSTIFGGPYQQDAQEFISFLLENLHDETNRLRDRPGEVQQPPLGPRSTALGNALLYWNEYRKYNDSLVDKYWRGVEVTDRRCRACGHPSLTYEHFDAIHLPIPPNEATTATTISDLLGQYCGADLLPEYKCDQCRRIDTTEKRVRLVRLPDLLCVSFRRFQGNEHYGFRKNNTAVVFPINGLDLTPYTVQGVTTPEDQVADGIVLDGPGRTEQQFRGPFVYDCYAVIVHSGTLKSGHYRSFIKDEGAADTNQWHHFDDARIEPVIIGSNDSRDMARRLYRDNQSSGASAYMVFYKRRT